MQSPGSGLPGKAWWAVERVTIRRRVVAITHQYEFWEPQGGLLLCCHRQLFRLKEAIRVFADRDRRHPVMAIQARQIIDFSAVYDVVDTQMNVKVGAVRRQGWSSLLRESWQILDIHDRVIGHVTEMGYALFRPLLRPKRLKITLGEQVVGYLRHTWNPFVFRADVDFSADASRVLDRRLGIAVATLATTAEGRRAG